MINYGYNKVGHKMKRRIIQINEELCNGCELCVSACHESAIQMINGKATLVSDEYCDGIGDCLPECPTNAIKMVERDADEYSQVAVDQRIASLKEAEKKPTQGHESTCGCQGSMTKAIKPRESIKKVSVKEVDSYNQALSQLTNWPVQLNLVNPNAEYLKGADILIAADCTAFAYADFHKEFIKGRVALIGCPKLDDNNYYIEKLTSLFGINVPNSITVVRMEVPCCGGIVSAVKQAMLNSGMIVPYNEVTITLEGLKK
jgi:Pyruvate/2-oxoacid:ferredoxin oxidoreductase delta subunit